MTLNAVVFPAPLGPISATNAPASTQRSSPDTAVSPPKRTVSPWISSSGIGLPRPGSEPASDREFALAHQALRPQDHRHNEQDGIEDHPPLSKTPQHLGSRSQHSRREDGTANRAQPAQHDEHDDLERAQ